MAFLLFVINAVTRIPLGEIIREVIPFLAVLIAALPGADLCARPGALAAADVRVSRLTDLRSRRTLRKLCLDCRQCFAPAKHAVAGECCASLRLRFWTQSLASALGITGPATIASTSAESALSSTWVSNNMRMRRGCKFAMPQIEPAAPIAAALCNKRSSPTRTGISPLSSNWRVSSQCPALSLIATTWSGNADRKLLVSSSDNGTLVIWGM